MRKLGKLERQVAMESFVAPEIISCPNCNAVIKNKPVLGRIRCSRCKKVFKMSGMIRW